MTLVKIDKKQKGIIAKMLAEMETKVRFYTVEKCPTMLQAEIDCDDPAMMWHLGKCVGDAIATEEALKVFGGK
jgi:hypothetical protein